MSWEYETTGWFKINEGDTKEFLVTKINKKEPHGKINGIPGKAYYYEFETNLGTLTVNNLGLFSSCVEAAVREGDRIKVNYIKKGSLGSPSRFSVIIVTKGKQHTNIEEFQPSPDEDSTTTEEAPF